MRWDSPHLIWRLLRLILPQGRGVEAFALLRAGTVAYTRMPGGFAARYDVTFLLREQETGEIVAERVLAETLRVSEYVDTQTTKAVRHQAFLAANPGAYICEVTIEDRNTGRSSFRRQAVIVPELGEGQAMLGRVVMMSRDEHGMLGPAVAFHLPRRRDSLSAQAALFNFLPDRPGCLKSFLSGLSLTPPRRSRLVFRQRDGDPGHAAVLSGTHGHGVHGAPPLLCDRAGVQRDGPPPLAVLRDVPAHDARPRLRGPSSEVDAALTSRRYFAIMGPGFPRPGTLSEMAAAAVYLMKDEERRALDSARSVDERRRLFDGFWLSLVKDRQIAADLIRKYYSRVEEANRLFSSFKEGWKTDRGMVYIVLGPPERIERSYDRETWYFNHPGSFRENAWQFRRVQFAPEQFVIEDYVLLRGVQYQMYWERVLSKWREGVVF